MAFINFSNNNLTLKNYLQKFQHDNIIFVKKLYNCPVGSFAFNCE